MAEFLQPMPPRIRREVETLLAAGWTWKDGLKLTGIGGREAPGPEVPGPSFRSRL